MPASEIMRGAAAIISDRQGLATNKKYYALRNSISGPVILSGPAEGISGQRKYRARSTKPVIKNNNQAHKLLADQKKSKRTVKIGGGKIR